VLRFSGRLDAELCALATGLYDGTLPLGVSTSFTIHDPKERRITAPCFRVRVVHHAIMNVCEPVFERVLIDDTYACRKGKGRNAALVRAIEFARGSGWFLKIDVRRYFDSIPHETLLGRLGRLFKDRPLLNLFERIVATHDLGGRRGLPIGSLTSQHFANLYLSGLDRLVKERLRVRGYVRYMDDALLWGRTAGELRAHLATIQTYLRLELGLELKPTPYINRVEHGVDFLGCRVFPSHLALNRRSRVRFRRKLHGLEAKHAAGVLGEETLQQRATALVAFTRASGVSSWRWRRRVIEQCRVFGQAPPPG
jgi:RNA-directed DNA polymerase